MASDKYEDICGEVRSNHFNCYLHLRQKYIHHERGRRCRRSHIDSKSSAIVNRLSYFQWRLSVISPEWICVSISLVGALSAGFGSAIVAHMLANSFVPSRLAIHRMRLKRAGFCQVLPRLILETRLSGHGGEAAPAFASHPEVSWNPAHRGRRCLSLRTRTTPSALALDIFESVGMELEMHPFLLKLMDYWGLIRVLQGAVASNFFGLACPAYCTQPSLALIILCFVLGLLVGSVGSIYLALRFGFVLLPSPPADFSPRLTGNARLLAYAHARRS